MTGDMNNRCNIEALFRQPHPSDPLVNRLISQSPVLKKMVQLKSIEAQLENSASLHESVLAHLELVEEADRAAGVGAMATMKLAYCDAAVACTVKYLPDEVEFRAAAERIWKGKVEKMTRTNGLFSEDLWMWKHRIGEGSFNRNIDYTDIAVKSVKRYVEAAWSAVEHAVNEPPPAVGAAERERLRELAHRRRTAMKWKAYEVNALRRGVRECGAGKWKSIWTMYEDVFGRRRNVCDLKDKWRNMSKRR